MRLHNKRNRDNRRVIPSRKIKARFACGNWQYETVARVMCDEKRLDANRQVGSKCRMCNVALGRIKLRHV